VQGNCRTCRRQIDPTAPNFTYKLSFREEIKRKRKSERKEITCPPAIFPFPVFFFFFLNNNHRRRHFSWSIRPRRAADNRVTVSTFLVFFF
jgi:hypothetical protein